MTSLSNKAVLPKMDEALPGRETPITVDKQHWVNGHSVIDRPDNTEIAMFAMGCFWGVERLFWQQPGVYSTAVGYSGGITSNPTYKEVCTGLTGHAEVVRVIFYPTEITYEKLLTLFWENHDPTQGMRQGADIGTQYRSVIYFFSSLQQAAAEQSLRLYQQIMQHAGDNRAITTQVVPATVFYFAENMHQQYLAKNPTGYCGLGGIGLCLSDKMEGSK